MEIDGKEIDIKTTVKNLERIVDFRFTYLQDAEVDAVYDALKILRHMLKEETE